MYMASQLLAAAKKGDVNAIEQALQAGGIATIDVADGFGNAAIHCAALKGHAGAVELLLKSKANPDAVGNVSRRRNTRISGMQHHRLLTFLCTSFVPTARAGRASQRGQIREEFQGSREAAARLQGKPRGGGR